MTGHVRALLMAAAVGAGGVLLLGGWVGVVAGTVGGWALAGWCGRRDTGVDRRRREELRGDLPFAVDLLGSCLSSGSSPVDAAGAVAEAVGGPLGDELRPVVRGLRMGADPAECWGRLGGDAELALLGRLLARASVRGTPSADAVARLAEDCRAADRRAATAAARRVGVLAVLPLGGCFLPAFVLVGVVPVVVGLAGAVLGSR